MRLFSRYSFFQTTFEKTTENSARKNLYFFGHQLRADLVMVSRRFSDVITTYLWIARSVCEIVLRFWPLFRSLLSKQPVSLYSLTSFRNDDRASPCSRAMRLVDHIWSASAAIHHFQIAVNFFLAILIDWGCDFGKQYGRRIGYIITN